MDIAFHFSFPQNLLETEWTKRSVLPQLRTSPPPSSAQKVHGVAAESKNTTLPPPPATPARTVTPEEQVSNASSDPDVTTPESDGSEEDEPATRTDRDPQSDEIIKQLEKGVPGWPGFGVGKGVNGGGGDGDNTRKRPRSPGRTQQQEQQQKQQHPQTHPPATTAAMATLQTTHAAQSQNPYQHFQQPYVQKQQQQMVNQPLQTQRSTTLGPDRSIITAAGGIAAIGGPSQVEKLPADTGKFSYGPFSLLSSRCLVSTADDLCVIYIYIYI